MKTKDPTGTLPSQNEGKEIIIEQSVTLPDVSAATALYVLAHSRLLRINEWHQIAGSISARFQLTDSSGADLSREAMEDDFVRIDIPGPGSKAGNGYDWVRIEQITELSGGTDAVAMRVRPAANPSGSSDHIAHFYDAAATSTFMVERDGVIVYARIIDRNTKPNDDTSSFTDQLRHSFVGAAAIGIFSRLQWESLAKAFIS